MRDKDKIFSNWHVSIAAEAIAAGQFARLGYDVSVQYGANQKEYDLVIAKGEILIKVSVKGTNDGSSWGLTQKYKANNSYHKAIDDWLGTHSSKTIVCLVQFTGKKINELPNVYIATPQEIASHLKNARKGYGNTTLHENHSWKSGAAEGTTDKIPDNWQFSKQRVDNLISCLYPPAIPDVQ